MNECLFYVMFFFLGKGNYVDAIQKGFLSCDENMMFGM